MRTIAAGTLELSAEVEAALGGFAEHPPRRSPPSSPSATSTVPELADYNPSQPRDSRGRFGSGGGGAGGGSAAAVVDALAAGERPDIAPDEVGPVMDAAAARTDNPDLTELHVEGTPKFGLDGLGYARDEMPVLGSSHQDAFISHVQAKGITVTRERVDAQSLKPMQNEVSASASGRMYQAMKAGSMAEKPMVVSGDSFVVDGHHRWGAATALSFEQPDLTVPVIRVDMPGRALRDEAIAWNKLEGIAPKKLGAHGLAFELYAELGPELYAQLEARTYQRDSRGRFGSGGSGGAGGGGAAVAELVDQPITPGPGPLAPDSQLEPNKQMWQQHADKNPLGVSSFSQPLRSEMKFNNAIAVGNRLETKMTPEQILATPYGARAAGMYSGGPAYPGQCVASRMMDDWAVTSGDHQASSLAMQEATRQEFGLKGAANPRATYDALDPQMAARVDDDLAANGELYRNYARAEYEVTQEYLASQGVTELTLYRGIGLKPDHPLAVAVDRGGRLSAEVPFTSNPMSSFAGDSTTAAEFAQEWSGKLADPHILSVKVPASRVCSTSMSGRGCLNEYEAIVLAGDADVATAWRT